MSQQFWPAPISDAPDAGVSYYAQLARAFTGVTDRNLAFWGDDFLDRDFLWTAATSGAGSAAVSASNIDGPGILRCVGPSAATTGYSIANSKGAGLKHTPNLRTKRWFHVSRFANTSAAGAVSGTRINSVLYNGRIVGVGIGGNLSTTNFGFISSPDATHYGATALSTVALPALGTFTWAWIGNDGTNIKGSFMDPATGIHEPPVQVDLAANLLSAGGVFQFGVLPNDILSNAAQQDQADFDLFWFWCER